jgi:FkbM family methyltransferase
VLYRALTFAGKYVGKPRGYERLVRRLVPPEFVGDRPPQLVGLRGEPLILADPRTPLGWNLLFFGTYEPELRAYFQSVLGEGFVAVDMGANVGWHTLLMAQCVGPGGRVIAFEPNPSVRDRLRFHVSLNRLPQVDVYPFAMTDRAERLPFNAPAVDDPHAGDGCLVSGPAATQDAVDVEATSFDALLPTFELDRLDLIKIDVEGFEWPALQGSEQAIVTFRPLVIFEFIREYLERGSGTERDLQDFFTRHRYRVFVFKRRGLEPLEGKRWPEAANLCAVPLP